METTTTIRFRVNGQERSVTTVAERPLLEVLREDLGLTGTKYGCGEGQCGACSVLIDGKRAFSCRTPVGRAGGKAVTTIEGLARPDGTLHPVQQAFLDEGAFQCGFCTPGMIVSAAALLGGQPHPSDADVRDWMDRNICRCCSYPKILGAVRRAAGRPDAGRPEAGQPAGR